MASRFIELVVRARRFVARTAAPSPAPRARLTARRQLGGELTQFSFRLALVIDLAYVGIGALGGAALGRAVLPAPPVAACGPDSSRVVPNDTRPDTIRYVRPSDLPSRVMR